MKSAYIWIALSVICVSCSSDLKTDYQEMLVIDGYLLPGEDLSVKIYRTLPLLEGDRKKAHLADVSAVLFHNGFPVDTLKPASLPEYLSDYPIVAEGTYRLEVEAPGFDKVYSPEIGIPTGPDFADLTYSITPVSATFQQFTFQWPVNLDESRKELYDLEISSGSLNPDEGSFDFQQQVFFGRIDDEKEGVRPVFKGDQLPVFLTPAGGKPAPDRLLLLMRTYDPHLKKYALDIDRAETDLGGWLPPENNVYSNIEGGRGCFGALRLDTLTLRLP